MVVSNKFLNASEVAVQQRFIEKIFEELSVIFPNQFNTAAEEDGVKEIVRIRKQGATLFITSQKGIFTWIALNTLLGESYFQLPEWRQYVAAYGKIGDYAIESLVNAINELCSLNTPDDNGHGLPQAAYDQLPDLARVAAEEIISNNKIEQIVFTEAARQYFLETAAFVITKNPYNAKISELIRSIQTNDMALWKINQPLQDINLKIVTTEVANMDLKRDIDAKEILSEDVTEMQQKFKENEETIKRSVILYSETKEKSAKQVEQIQEKNKALKRQVEQLKVQKN